MSQFTNYRSIEQFKRENSNEPLRIIKSKSGKHFFACGQVVGYATEDSLTLPAEQLQVVHLTTEDGKEMEMLCRRGVDKALRTL